MVRYITIKPFGLALPHPTHEQGDDHLKIWIHNIGKNNLVGQFFHSILEQYKMKFGTVTALLSMYYEKYRPFISYGWVKFLWKLLYDHGIVLDPEEPVGPKLLQYRKKLLTE